MHYLLCHGFGFDNSYWKNLAPLLDGPYSFYDDDFVVNPDYKYVGIGHSIGFQKLNNSGIQFEYLVGLQGFLNFCGTDAVERSVRLENLKQIAQIFKKNPREFLGHFYEMCGYPARVPDEISEERLLKDLDDMMRDFKHCGCKTLIIGSNTDKIVPMSLIHDNFDGLCDITIKSIDDASHALGFLKAAETFDVIKEYGKLFR